MKSLFQSLRWRLQAWHGLLLLLVVAGSTTPAYRLAKDNQMQRIDKELALMERNLFRAMVDSMQDPAAEGAMPEAESKRQYFSPEEFIRRLSSRKPQLPASFLSSFQGNDPGYAYFGVRDREDKVILQSDNAPEDMVFLPIPASDLAEDARSIGNRRETARSSSHGLKIIVGRDITTDLQEMQRIAWVHLLTGLGVWFFGLLGGWWLSGRAIRPIETISKTASRIAEGNLRERIDVTAMDNELGQLSHVLNQTFERLHDAFERQRQFTADASHELRTPITILLSETQRILKRERSPEEYREALATCSSTAQRMRRLVEALLILARQDNEGPRSHHADCDLAAILDDAVSHLRPLAQERGLTLTADLSPTLAHADAGTLAILASNLLSNALQHGGNVHVTCGLQDGKPGFTVRDDGPGIAEADQQHIFERFYRADQARTGTSGHSGLGLAIAKAIVDNHGGSISVRSTPGQGATFEVILPR